MNILICYATTEGHTRRIAQAITETANEAGHKATFIDATVVEDDEIDRHDAVIMAGSVHIGRYQSALVHRISTWLEKLKTKPNAFVSVSLAAASDDPDDLEGIEECAQKLFEQTGWTPDHVHHAAGAFRYTQYDFFKRWAMRFIAMQKGASTDTSRDTEYTDWDALKRFTREFLEFANHKLAA
ncbi:MAG TPA: flavodoxin domain-containing protein [Afifellaceae bacterium]|nr:flavodoxin domain-containing protein [Afifellaceae bacterium]